MSGRLETRVEGRLKELEGGGGKRAACGEKGAEEIKGMATGLSERKGRRESRVEELERAGGR